MNAWDIHLWAIALGTMMGLFLGAYGITPFTFLKCVGRLFRGKSVKKTRMRVAFRKWRAANPHVRQCEVPEDLYHKLREELMNAERLVLKANGYADAFFLDGVVVIKGRPGAGGLPV